MRDQLLRMVREAKDRLHDAEILATSLNARSDSPAFLNVLAFEVLLKAAVLVSTGSRPGSHNYRDLWSKLPSSVCDQIVTVAKVRMPGHTDFSNLEKLLGWYRFVFEKARYQYELYDGMTLEEQRALGELWVKRGAPVEEARVQYYPNELFCLTEGLIAYVESAL
jgi:hypothetical protein